MNGHERGNSDSRRRFLQGSGAGLGLLVLGAGRAAHGAASLTSLPSAFEASTTGALIRVQATEAMQVRIDFSADAAMKQLRQGPMVNLKKATDFAATLPLEGLTAGQAWYYRVVDTATGQPVSPVNRLKTAPAAPQPFTFAFSSCMHHDYKPFQLFDEIGKRDPDFFLHMGDTVYADQPRKQFAPSVAFYRRKHTISRQDDALQQFLARHVTYAIWDDHEIENGAHGGHPAMAEALQVFREFWPCRTAAQKQWFLDALKTSTAPFKFIITSVPFHGGSDDAWGTYKTERDEIAGFIKKHKIPGIVFLTGDYHMARDFTNSRTGLREYMAGPIANRPNYQKSPENRARNEKSGQFHYGEGNSFGFVRVDPRAERATLEIAGADGKPMFSVDLKP